MKNELIGLTSLVGGIAAGAADSSIEVAPGIMSSAITIGIAGKIYLDAITTPEIKKLEHLNSYNYFHTTITRMHENILNILIFNVGSFFGELSHQAIKVYNSSPS